MMSWKGDRNRAFSLLELVIVVIVIGIIAAIAIPRMSRGAAGAGDAALSADLAVLRHAIDSFATEHGGSFPSNANIADQLTQYTDNAGNPLPNRDNTHIFGPYIRQIPPAPLGFRKGATGISNLDGPDVGWIYNEATGEIHVNAAAAAKDVSGTLYIDH